MPSTGATFPAVSANDATVGTKDWNNTGSPGNVGANDGAVCRVDLNAETSKYLKMTDFANVTAGSTIDGIEAIIELDDGAGVVTGCIDDSSVRLTTGGSYLGDNKARGTPGVTCNIDGIEVVTYGGSTDTWGRTWTAAEVNASDFGIGYSGVEADGENEGIEIDYCTINIYYTEPSGEKRVATLNLLGVGT